MFLWAFVIYWFLSGEVPSANLSHIMPIWGQIGMQIASNTLMESIIYLHDYMMMILSVILASVVYFSSFLITKNQLDSKTMESHFLETVWTVIPMLILIAMAYPSLIMLYFMESSEVSNLEVMLKVTAHQWYWEYEMDLAGSQISFDSVLLQAPSFFYTLETGKSLDLPVNKIIGMFITSADVIHSFTVPTLGVKVDAIPGRINVLYLSILTVGQFFGQCSEICGANHSFMPISIKSL